MLNLNNVKLCMTNVSPPLPPSLFRLVDEPPDGGLYHGGVSPLQILSESVTHQRTT